MKDSKRTLLATLGLLFASLLWGASFYQMKDVVASINPLPFVAIRMGGGALVFAVLALFLKKNLLKNWKQGLILGSILSVVMISQTAGIKYTTASNSGFITGMFIVFIPVFSYFVYKRTTPLIKLFAVAVNILGLWILTGGMSRFNFGDALTLLTALSSGMHIVYISEVTKEESADLMVLCFHQFLVTSVAALIISLCLGLSFDPGGSGNKDWLSYFIPYITFLYPPA